MKWCVLPKGKHTLFFLQKVSNIEIFFFQKYSNFVILTKSLNLFSSSLANSFSQSVQTTVSVENFLEEGEFFQPFLLLTKDDNLLRILLFVGSSYYNFVEWQVVHLIKTMSVRVVTRKHQQVVIFASWPTGGRGCNI